MPKAAQQIAAEAGADDLDRDALMIGVLALGEIDDAHAAAADLAEQAVRTDARPGRQRIGERRDRTRRDEPLGAPIGAQQRIHLGPQRLVIRAQIAHPALALVIADVEDADQHIVDSLPACGVHVSDATR